MAELAGPIRSVVFDLDGTLVTLGIDWADVRRRVQALLETDASLSPLLPALAALGLDPPQRAAVYDLVDEIELEHVRRLERDDALVLLLSRLASSGRRLGLVTLQGRRPALEALERLGIRSMIEVLVSRDESWSRRTQIERCLRELRASAPTALVVGDRTEDVIAAKAVGCHTVAVGERHGLPAEIQISSVLELATILGLEAA